MVVLQYLHRLVQDMTLARRLLLPVLQALQVLAPLSPGFRRTDDTLASTGISGVWRLPGEQPSPGGIGSDS